MPLGESESLDQRRDDLATLLLVEVHDLLTDYGDVCLGTRQAKSQDG